MSIGLAITQIAKYTSLIQELEPAIAQKELELTTAVNTGKDIKDIQAALLRMKTLLGLAKDFVGFWNEVIKSFRELLKSFDELAKGIR